MFWLYAVIVAVSLVYYLLRKNYSYWETKGIPGPKPVFIFGNLKDHIFGKKTAAEALREAYTDFEEYPIVGVYRGLTPCILIRDPELIKLVAVSDFKHFHDNDLNVDKKVDPLLGRNPFVLKGEEWKTARTQLTPAFTSGKMKSMFPLIQNIAERMVEYVNKQITAGKTKPFGLEGKELCSRFTIENVASCAFGVDANDFEEDKSMFRQLADQFIPTDDRSMQGCLLALAMAYPQLFRLFTFKIVPKDVDAKVTNIIVDTMKYRDENNVDRPDFLQYLMQLKERLPGFTYEEATGHAASFFGDGYETTAQVMHIVLYELAANQDVQQQIRKEINDALEKSPEGKFTYENIQNMDYLDACIYETFRLHAPLPLMFKTCTKQYHYQSQSDNYNISHTFNPGDVIVFHVQGMHRDPKYFDEPEAFKPERMMNRDAINKFVYMPFGAGQRACIGQRFGLLQIKIGLVNLLKNFHITLNPKTKNPLQYKPWLFFTSPLGGVWLDFEKI